MKTDEKEADRLWGGIVHSLQQRCLFDGTQLALTDPCSGPIEAHHLFGRSSKAWRWRVEFGVGLCAHHHRNSKVASPHGGPKGFWDQFELLDAPRVESLRSLRFSLKPETGVDAVTRLKALLRLT